MGLSGEEERVMAESAMRWLVSRERHPRDARESWEQGRAATLSAGFHFDAIRLWSPYVKGAIKGAKDRPAIETRFRDAGIAAAVIVSRTKEWYTVLVRPEAGRGRDVPDTEYLGRTMGYIAAPTPSRREPPGSYWLLPAPDEPSMLATSTAVQQLLGRDR